MTERLKNANLRWETGELKAWDLRELCEGVGIPSLWDTDRKLTKVRSGLIHSLTERVVRVGMTPYNLVKRGAR